MQDNKLNTRRVRAESVALAKEGKMKVHMGKKEVVAYSTPYTGDNIQQLCACIHLMVLAAEPFDMSELWGE